MSRTTGPDQSEMFGSKKVARKVPKNKANMTRAEFARQHGKSRAWTTQLVKRGVLVNCVNDDGTINFHKANRELKAQDPAKAKARKPKKNSNAQTTGNGRKNGEDPAVTFEDILKILTDQTGTLPDFETIKVVKEMATARKLDIENRVRLGELVKAADMEHSMYEKIRQFRDQLLLIPDRMMKLLAAETDPLKIRELLMAEYVAVIPAPAERENGTGSN